MPRHSTLTYPTRPLDAITALTIHHTVGTSTPTNIAHYHINTNGWPGIGYHFLIMSDGKIYQTNHLTTKSFHAGSYNVPGDENYWSVGIALNGNFTTNPPPQAQKDAARKLVAHLKATLPAVKNVIPHRHMPGASTACPGATWEQWLSYVAGEPVNPKPAVIDLLQYLRGNGRLYEVQHSSGAQERFQTQIQGNRFYQTKNSQYEQFEFDNDFIWRGLDTSPGPAPNEAERPGKPRIYLQYEAGKDVARWCKRYMSIGETYTGPGHTVQFYYKSDCALSALNSGQATNKVTLVAKHTSKTWNGITVNDVVELKTGTGETMFFAKGFGLVAWSSQWGSSAISEVHQPGARPDNIRESVC